MKQKLNIPLQAVESSNVAKVGYDPDTERFAVQFKRTPGVYVYAGVSAKVADGVLNATSVGSAVQSSLVRGGFAFERIEPESDSIDDTPSGD